VPIAAPTIIDQTPGQRKLDFGRYSEPSYVSTRSVSFGNTGTAEYLLGPVTIGGADADNFTVVGSSCSDPVPPRGTCTVTVAAKPLRRGQLQANLVLTADPNSWNDGLPHSIPMIAFGGEPRPPRRAGEKIHATTPIRVLDTREPVGPTAGLALGQAMSVAVAVRGHFGVPDIATGVIANVTVTEPTSAGFVSVYPSGVARPTVSTQNYVAGDTVANLATLALGTDGALAVFNSAGDTHVVIDIVAWLGDDLPAPEAVPTPNGMVVDVDTRRLRARDTRYQPVPGSPDGRLGPGESMVVFVGASAALVNVTATEPTADTYLTAYTPGTPRPLVSSLNVSAGHTRPNLVLAVADGAGFITIYNHAGRTHVIVDIVALLHELVDVNPGFPGAQYQTTGATILLISPSRVYDSRLRDGPLQPGQDLLVPEANTIVPTKRVVEGVILNSTVTEPTAPGYLSVTEQYIYASAGNVVSTLNFVAGETVPNGAWLSAKQARIINGSVGTTHVVLDVQALLVYGGFDDFVPVPQPPPVPPPFPPYPGFPGLPTSAGGVS
jgi:hypothetical protein